MLIRYKPDAGWQRQSRKGWGQIPRWAAVALLGDILVGQYEPSNEIIEPASPMEEAA